MQHVFVTLKGLKIDIPKQFNVSGDFALYGEFSNIDGKLNKAINMSTSERMKFILDDESRGASYAYKRFSGYNEESVSSSETVELYNNLNLFLNSLWLAADYSVIVKEGIVFDEEKHGILDFSALSFYNSDLKLDLRLDRELPINKHQLMQANTYYRIIKKINTKQKETRIEIRILRAIDFVNEARKTRHAYQRIAFLIIALECLLLNQEHEINTQTALKTAYLSAKAKPKRNFKETYSLIKKCYGIRSSFLHGSKFESEKDAEKESKDLEMLIKLILGNLLDYKEFKNLLIDPGQIVGDVINSIKVE